MIKQIFKGNTVAFTALPTVDGKKQPLEGTTVGFMVKKDRADSDDEAIISKVSNDGHFLLTPEDTNIEGHYWYELRWFDAGAVYTIDMGTVDFIDTVYD